MRCALLALFLTACGGSSGAAPAPITAPVVVDDPDFLHYALWFVPHQGTFTGGIWTSRPISSSETLLWWSTNYYERFRLGINPTDNREWIWLCGYGAPDVMREYALTVRKVTVQFGNVIEDVTPPAGSPCQPYALRYPPMSYVVTVSGDVHADAVSCQLDGTCKNLTQFFHREEWTCFFDVLNVGWTGDSNKTRRACRQREAYWDNNPAGNPGWGTGSGSIGTDGLPDGVQVTYGREQTVALGVGFAWTLNSYADPNNPDPAKRAPTSGFLISSIPL